MNLAISGFIHIKYWCKYMMYRITRNDSTILKHNEPNEIPIVELSGHDELIGGVLSVNYMGYKRNFGHEDILDYANGNEDYANGFWDAFTISMKIVQGKLLVGKNEYPFFTEYFENAAAKVYSYGRHIFYDKWRRNGNHPVCESSVSLQLKKVRHIKTFDVLGAHPYYIYFLCDNNAVVYVGQTVNLFNRIKAHSKDKEFDSAHYIVITKAEVDKTEIRYIREFRPKYNKTNNGDRET